MMKLLRCEHNHTAETHPNCFEKSNVKGGILTPKYWKTNPQKYYQWYNYEGSVIGYLDIETDDRFAQNGLILSWAIKERHGRVRYDYIKPEDRRGDWMRWDYRIVKSLLQEMSRYNLFVTYYGTLFDRRFIYTRALYHELPFPKYGAHYHIDLYYIVRNRFLLFRNSLANVTEFLGIEGKTKLGTYWKAAIQGDKKGMSELVKHNREDVKILEELHDEIENHVKFSKKSF